MTVNYLTTSRGEPIRGENGEPIELPWWIPTPERIAEREALLKSRYFLVQLANGPAGEIWRCSRCGGKHRYLTLQCVEQPFPAITGGLYGYFHTMADTGAFTTLTRANRFRYELLLRKFTARQQPAIGINHPGFAAAFQRDPNDIDIGTMALGILEAIPIQEARRLVDKINMTARPPLVVDGINDAHTLWRYEQRKGRV